EVRLLLPLGDQLISADSGGDVVVWSIKGGGEQEEAGLQSHSPVLVSITICSLPPTDIYLRLNFDPGTFDVSAMMHPSTYLNKVLLGSSQGALQLWNIKTRFGYLSRRGAGPGCSGVVRATVARQPPSITMATMEKTSSAQDGTLQSFSTVHERFNKNLGHGQFSVQPVSSLWCSGITRQSDWDGIVACHRGRLTATTWSYQRCTMGAHHLKPPFAGKDAVAMVTT
ncbi:hypothetical protein XENOCAPTIV_020701, partial [Xenoophorus captivus]